MTSSKREIICACGCGRKRMVRVADIKRGWGKFYDKSCKAKHQSKTGGSDKYYQKKAKYKKYQDLYGGNPQFNQRTGEYEGFTLSMEDMAGGE